MSKKTTTVTVKEIARLAGVSIGTVDRVLHGRDGVSALTKARIESIVEASGFRPNALARQLSRGGTYRLRVLIPKAGQDSGYWGLCLGGIQAASRNLSAFAVGVEVVEFDRHDPEGYRRILEEVIADPGDGLLVAPVLPDVIGPALARLPRGLPYAFFDGIIPEGCPVFSVGQDAFSAGRLAGRLLSLLAPGKGCFAAINAHPEDRHIRQRIAGFEDFFAQAGDGPGGRERRRILVRECPGFEEAGSCDAWLEALFAEEAGIEGVLVASATGHLAGEWLGRKGMKEACALLSWDLVPRNVLALREGLLDCVISQRPFEQGRLGLEGLYRKVVHDEAGAALTVASEIILRENLPPQAAMGEEP